MRSDVNFQRFLVETSVLLAALRYKPEGRWFVSRWGHWDFFTDLMFSAALWACGRLSLLTNMSTTNIS